MVRDMVVQMGSERVGGTHEWEGEGDNCISGLWHPCLIEI